MPISVILFDAGGVLLHPDWHAVAAVARSHGLSVDPLDARAVERRVVGVGETDEVRWKSYMAGVLDLQPSSAPVLDELWRVHCVEHLWRRVEPGTDAVLATLRVRGFRLGVVSNSTGVVEEVLTQVGLARHFELVLDSARVGIEKPDPRIFLMALDGLGVIASECLFVGDTPRVDTAPARALGMQVVLVDPDELHADEPCRVRGLAELLNHVGRSGGACVR